MMTHLEENEGTHNSQGMDFTRQALNYINWEFFIWDLDDEIIV